jgi:hypothetical protein
MLKRYLLNKGFKKRYVVFALLAMEILSLPAAAGIVGQALSNSALTAETVPAVNMVLLDEKEGQKRFAVASSTKFSIHTDRAGADYEIRLYKSGQVNGKSFGDKAQMPGPVLTCAAPSKSENTIFQSLRGTALGGALNEKDILNQAIIVEINYDESLNPEFTTQDIEMKGDRFTPVSCLSVTA